MASKAYAMVASLLIAGGLFWMVPASAQETDASASAPAAVPEAAPQDAAAGGGASDAENLAQQLSNPVASLISVPFQENMDFGAGPDGDGFKSTLNIQPVIPLALNDKWNLIVRTILPVVAQTDITGQYSSESGLGDTVQSFFLSPADPGPSGIVWGVGPVTLYPTATERALGGGKWGAGFTGLVLKQSGPNTFGFLGNQVWSVAGPDDRADASAMFLQPFFSHTTKAATTYGINVEAAYDWKHDQWVVPINLSVTQLAKMGKQPISVGGGVRYYVEKPTGGPDWGVRLILTFLFPKK